MPATLPKSLLIEKYEKLPLELREAIASVDTANIILATGRTHGLPIDKIGKLAEETGYIMGGVAPAKEFIPALEEALEISHDQAKAIAVEINQKIFLPIREHLKKMHGEKWADEITSGAKLSTVKPAAPPAKVPPPAPRAPEIRPAPRPQPKPEIKETKPEAPVIPPVVKAPPPLPPLADEPEEGGFVKKPEPLVIGPLGGARREPIEKAFEVKPLPVTAPPLAKAPLPPSEVKPAPAAPAVPLAAKAEISPKEIKPFQPVVMEGEEGLPIEKVAEGEKKKTYEPSITAKPAFAPPKPLEYIRAKDEVIKELKEFAEAVEVKIAAAAKPPAEAEKPIITKEKIIAEIERVREELAAKKKKVEEPAPAAQVEPARQKSPVVKTLPVPAVQDPAPPVLLPPSPAETEEFPVSPPAAPPRQPKTDAVSYGADPYREPIE